MADTFKVSHKSAVALLVAVGFKNADKWDSTKIKNRLGELDQVATDEIQESFEDAKVKKLCKGVLAAIGDGKAIEVSGEPAEEAPAEKKTSKNDKAKKAPAKEEEDEDEEKPAKKKKASKEQGEKKVGVIATIADILTKASAKSPVTKKEVLDILVENFPDKKAESMKSTINHQIPSYLRKAGMDVQKNDRGYWISR